MKRVYFAENAMVAHHVKSLLDAEGIACEVTGESGGTSVGIGTTHLSTKPSVWVGNPDDYARALEIVRKYEASAPQDLPAWTCAQCKETVEGSFDICWNCGADRPETSADAGDPSAPST